MSIPGQLAPNDPRPVFMVFGAHWCEPCHRITEDAAEQLGDDAMIVFVHLDDVDIGMGLGNDEIQEAVEDMVATLPEGVTVLTRGRITLFSYLTGLELGDDIQAALPVALMILPDGTIYGRITTYDADLVHDQLAGYQAAIASSAAP
ncbi:MAG: hypothetical protein KDA28_02755 [Phycisphaerales bacterium]|nr:hypothetical protein [Phycisphaerales bacterium]